MKTKAQIFIVESLDLDDEEEQRHEGEILTRMLRLGGKPATKYYYIRTKRELREIARMFGESGYRYLHISCHADDEGIATTFDEIPYEDLAVVLKPHLRGRRVFVSACEMANETFAECLIPGSGCASLIGPGEDIAFHDAAALWVSFYHLMFKKSENRMRRADLRGYVEQLSSLFDVDLRYFAKSTNSKGYECIV